MRRTLLALAMAGLSVAAYASPPPGGGAQPPLNVNVTNPVLPVEVSNAEPIPVTITDQPASKLYYSEMGATCPYANQCVAEFAAVPAGKRLVVTNIRLVATNQNSGVGIFGIRPKSTSRLLVVYPVASFNGAYFGNTFSANSEVEVIFEPGSIPVLEFGAGSGNELFAYGVSFGLTGYLTDVSP